MTTAVVKLTDLEVKRIADEVLGREMKDFAFSEADVRSRVDADDVPLLVVTAKVGAGVPALSGAAISRIHGALHDRLLFQGEERFPYFRISRSDDEALDGGPEDWAP